MACYAWDEVLYQCYALVTIQVLDATLRTSSFHHSRMLLQQRVSIGFEGPRLLMQSEVEGRDLERKDLDRIILLVNS